MPTSHRRFAAAFVAVALVAAAVLLVVDGDNPVAAFIADIAGADGSDGAETGLATPVAQAWTRAIGGAARMPDDPDDPDLRRLFPRAHDDPESEEQYRSLVRDQLLDGRWKAAATMRETLRKDTITADEADAWLRALNDLRLVLGTRLDVTEDLDYENLDLNEPRGRELPFVSRIVPKRR